MMRNVETVSLASGELISIRDSRALAITVVKGRVWITAENDTRDAFPTAGQTVAVPVGQLAVVEAVEDAQVRVEVAPSLAGRMLDGLLMAVAYGVLALRQRITGLRLSISRGAAMTAGVAACRDGGC